jgi:ABC-type polysaccharide/polyol phosphate export permease
MLLLLMLFRRKKRAKSPSLELSPITFLYYYNTSEAMVENLKELYKFRALLMALVTRHLHSRYRGSMLGLFWTLLNPLCLMVVYTLVFHYYLRGNSIPHYEIFLFCGLLPWIWFTSSLDEGTSSIVSSGHLITKSMFPAHVLPAVSVTTNFCNFLFSIPLLFLFMFFQGMAFHWSLLALPIVFFLQLFFLNGLTVLLSSVNVMYRDVQHIVGNIITLLFFLNPIVYAPSVIPERFQWTLYANPCSLFTITYQQIILDGVIAPEKLGLLFVYVFGVLVIGHNVFNRLRERLAEYL